MPAIRIAAVGRLTDIFKMAAVADAFKMAAGADPYALHRLVWDNDYSALRKLIDDKQV